MGVVDSAVIKAAELLGVTGLPSARFGKQANYFSNAEEWSATLVNKFQAAVEAMEQTSITADEVDGMNIDQARAAMTDMYGFATSAAGNALQAIKTGDVSAEFELPGEIARRALIAIYAYNANGVYLHTEGAFARAIKAGRVTESEAMEHAWRCAAIFDAIVGMKKAGALKWAGPAKPISGLGFTGVEIVILVIAGVIGALVEIAFIYIIVQSINQAVTQKRALDQCDKLLEEGKYEEHQRCMQSVLEASNRGTSDLMNNIAKSSNVLIWTIALSIVGVVAVKYIAPELLAMKTRRTPQEA